MMKTLFYFRFVHLCFYSLPHSEILKATHTFAVMPVPWLTMTVSMIMTVKLTIYRTFCLILLPFWKSSCVLDIVSRCVIKIVGRLRSFVRSLEKNMIFD